ncbi:50S ribosomal protein L3 [Chlamydiales bacterium]|nr:50S ribosomal protein L3 [Chlamydiales bacterium]
MTRKETTHKNRLSIMGKKRGMTQRFDEKGQRIPCTVIEVEPNVVVQVKSKETDGYEAVQLGYKKIVVKHVETMKRRVSKPLLGHFKKAGVDPVKCLNESRLNAEEAFELGQKIGVEYFSDISFIDATSTSKGKGYQGVIKRHNFSGGPASHGSGFHRHAGSTGMRSTPGRCLPGGKKAGQMGNEQKTVQGLKVVQVNSEDNVLIVKGAVPGPIGSTVYIAPAIKGQG